MVLLIKVLLINLSLVVGCAEPKSNEEKKLQDLPLDSELEAVVPALDQNVADPFESQPSDPFNQEEQATEATNKTPSSATPEGENPVSSSKVISIDIPKTPPENSEKTLSAKNPAIASKLVCRKNSSRFVIYDQRTKQLKYCQNGRFQEVPREKVAEILRARKNSENRPKSNGRIRTLGKGTFFCKPTGPESSFQCSKSLYGTGRLAH